MSEQYDDIRSMIKSKSDRTHSKNTSEEDLRFNQLMKANFEEKSKEKEEKSEEKEPKSEEKEPKTDSEPPKSDPEEAQDDEPAPEMSENEDFGGEIDNSELGEILAEIEDELGEEVAQEIIDIMVEHLNDEGLEEVMEAKEEAGSAPKEAKMEPFDGGATVIMGVDGADEPEDGYVSIRECISTRKSGDRHSVYNREVSAFHKLYGGDYQTSGWDDANPEFAQPMNPEVQRRPVDTSGPENKGNPSGEPEQSTTQTKSPDTQTPSNPETKTPETKTPETKTPETKTPEPDAKTPETNDDTKLDQAKDKVDPKQAGKDARSKEKQRILQEKADAWDKQYGAGQQAAANQPRAVAGGGNNYYSLFGPKLNGNPGLLSRLAQAYRKWRLNRASVKQAGQQATAAASSASAPAAASPAPAPAPAAGTQTTS